MSTSVHEAPPNFKQHTRGHANGAGNTNGDASGNTSDTHHTHAHLSPVHLKMLREDSGISDEVIAARGYRTITKKSEAKDAGFSDSQCHVPALLIPIHNVAGDIVLHQIRPDDPRRNNDGKAIKYETPHKSRMALDIPPGARAQLRNPNRPLFITEGAKKADCGVSHGLFCIALLGVWNWRGTTADDAKIALPDWELIHLEGREVFIVFDSDVSLKPSVYAALKRLKAFLELRKANVRVIYLDPKLDGSKVGLDDFFVAGGTIATLMAKASATLREPEKRAATAMPEFKLTDLGNAERFIHQHGLDVRYCALAKQWFLWDGTRWAKDETQRIQTLAHKTVRSLYGEAERKQDSADSRAVAQHAIKSESSKCLTALISLAQSLCPVKPAEFDTDPWLFNVSNGTIDLRTGDLLPHRREDLITKLSPVAYDRTAQCPTWLAFLARALANDIELIEYVKCAVGYSLTGVTTEEILFFLYGKGRNGKSKFLATVSALMGDYGQPAAFSTFAKTEKDRVRDDIADLDGARLVTTIEANAGRALDEAQIKSLTGSDAQRARFLFGRQFTFIPVFKLWLAANYKPIIHGTDVAIWERIKLIPFTVEIPRAERDKDLFLKLAAELPGILIWALEGCYHWKREGLKEPEAVKIATESYRTEMDQLGSFIEERCVTEAHAKAKTSDLFNAFVLWSGDKYLKQNVFGRMLTERGYPLERKIWRCGICLSSEETME